MRVAAVALLASFGLSVNAADSIRHIEWRPAPPLLQRIRESDRRVVVDRTIVGAFVSFDGESFSDYLKRITCLPDVILVGEVISRTSEFEDQGDWIHTRVQVRPETVVVESPKWTSRDRLDVYFSGGEITVGHTVIDANVQAIAWLRPGVRILMSTSVDSGEWRPWLTALIHSERVTSPGGPSTRKAFRLEGRMLGDVIAALTSTKSKCDHRG